MASTIPAVLDALLASWAVALPGVQVVDGQPLTVEPDIVCVGFTGLPGERSVEATEDRGQLATGADRERYDVYCLASSLKGETDARAVRVRAFELVEAIRADLQRDPRLGGLVMSARLAVLGLEAEQTKDGATASLLFTVRIDAFAR